jgi:hypothetical protein
VHYRCIDGLPAAQQVAQLVLVLLLLLYCAARIPAAAAPACSLLLVQ